VEADVASVARVCSAAGALLKVILETALLTEDEIRTACRICVAANANFVKTSTGFSGGGATADAVRIMAWEVAEAGLGVKASGGIRTWGDAQTMVEAGATRIGASASLKILEEARAAGH